MSKLSHIGDDNRPSMVDVSRKPPQKRTATAKGIIKLQAETLALISDNHIKKGNVLLTAELAGVQSAKKTSDLIPLCHPLLLSKIDVRAVCTDDGVLAEATVVCTGQTGVEMEALTAVSTALLTVYDMCKAVDKNMLIGGIVLVDKVKEDV
ncbi:MAG: cyclic pyranopterin monophosphate synthase MoaC [Pontiella sp.]